MMPRLSRNLKAESGGGKAFRVEGISYAGKAPLLARGSAEKRATAASRPERVSNANSPSGPQPTKTHS
jgi:hypothetical protein